MALALAKTPAALVPHIPIGGLVVQQVTGRAVLPAAVQLLCSTAALWDGRIAVCTPLDTPMLAQRITALVGWIGQHVPTHGLAPLLGIRPSTRPLLSTTCSYVYAVLSPWLARRSLVSPPFWELLARLVGIGEGLTPSGDDLVVGLLAVLHATGHFPVALPVEARRRLLQHGQARTTDLSIEFLRCALEGHFAEPLALFVAALLAGTGEEWQDYAALLATVGHSSGVDAMVGVVLGGWLVTQGRAGPWQSTTQR
jgi:hypothetical protein